MAGLAAGYRSPEEALADVNKQIEDASKPKPGILSILTDTGADPMATIGAANAQNATAAQIKRLTMFRGMLQNEDFVHKAFPGTFLPGVNTPLQPGDPGYGGGATSSQRPMPASGPTAPNNVPLGPGQRTGMIGPPMPGAMQQTGNALQSMLDAYNPANPQEVRLRGFASLMRYFGPEAVPQSYQNQMGGPLPTGQ